jgi:hypothetical protein
MAFAKQRRRGPLITLIKTKMPRLPSAVSAVSAVKKFFVIEDKPRRTQIARREEEEVR